jgi:hypothetical protein
MIHPIITVASGTPLAQSKGTDGDRAGEEVGAQRRRVYHEKEAEVAAGVGEPDGDNHEAAEREGDGRRPWNERQDERKPVDESTAKQSKDPSRQSGNFLDVTG